MVACSFASVNPAFTQGYEAHVSKIPNGFPLTWLLIKTTTTKKQTKQTKKQKKLALHRKAYLLKSSNDLTKQYFPKN